MEGAMNFGARMIGLAGVSGAGKDTAGDYLVRRHGFRRIAFADPLKRWVRDIFGLTDAQLWGDERNHVDSRLGRTPREVYQEFGKACTGLDADVLIRAFLREADQVEGTGACVVCTDVRTRREMEAIQQRGGSVWRITRPGAGVRGAAGKHETETEIATLPDLLFDGMIRNDGVVSDLHGLVDEIVAGRQFVGTA